VYISAQEYDTKIVLVLELALLPEQQQRADGKVFHSGRQGRTLDRSAPSTPLPLTLKAVAAFSASVLTVFVTVS